LNTAQQPPRSSLIEALRFQLRETTEVEVSPELLATGSAAARIRRASETMTSAQARFAVWLEATEDSDDARGFLLYVVGGRSGRAVVEVVRLPAATDGPDIDRTLALKVSEIVESALNADDLAFGAALNPAPPTAKHRSTAPPPIGESPATKGQRAELMIGGVLVSAAGNSNGQLGVRLGLGYVAQTGALELELCAAGQLLTPQRSPSASGYVRTTEQATAVGFGLRNRGAIQLGATLEGGLRWLHAEGFSGREMTGTESLLVPTLRLGPELRAALWQRGWLAFGAGGEWMPVERKFAVGGAPVADWGRVRAAAVVSFIVSMP